MVELWSHQYHLGQYTYMHRQYPDFELWYVSDIILEQAVINTVPLISNFTLAIARLNDALHVSYESGE